MTKPSPKPFLFVGKPVRDEYGRHLGRIASFMVKPNGRIDGVFVEHGDGEFLRYPNDQFKIDGESVVILPSIKLKVKSLCSEIPLIWRKDQALSALSKRKGFPADLFDVLHENFDGALNQVKEEGVSCRSVRCASRKLRWCIESAESGCSKHSRRHRPTD